MSVPITAVYGALEGLLNFALASHVSLARWRDKVFVGDAPTADVQRRSRAHGNHAEYAALAVVLQLLVESSGAPSLIVHAIGAAFLFGRLLHAAGVLGKVSMLSRTGVGFTYVYFSAVPLYLLYLFFR